MTLASIADAVITADIHGSIDYLNPAAEKLLGWPLKEAAGQALPAIFHAIDALTGETIVDPVALVVQQPAQQQLHGNAMLVCRGGLRQAIIYSAAPIRSATGDIIRVVVVIKSVPAEQAGMDDSPSQACHDALTGVFNHSELERRLEELIDTADRHDRQHALLYLNLDHFSVINHLGGYPAGDALLRRLGAVLGNRVRGSDTLARLSADAFGVLLVDCPVDHAVKVAQTLRTTVAELRFAWEGREYAIGASVGVAPIAGKREDNTDLISVAKAACHTAKEKGRSQVEVLAVTGEYAPAPPPEESQWVARIHDALARGRFQVCYQSIWPLAPSAQTAPHYEALIRMLDAHGNAIAPMMFLPAAERHNLMAALDRKLISMVFAESRQSAQRSTSGETPMLFINLSGATLDDALFFDFLQQQLAHCQIDPATICFEVTETTMLAHLRQASMLLQQLKTIGCSFSLDDFGRGPPLFDYLKNLPVDYLKIHGSFVCDMAASPTDAAMVAAINNIGHLLGIKTIAKWVENAPSLEALRQIGVDYVQGYLLDRPQPMSLAADKPSQVMAGF